MNSPSDRSFRQECQRQLRERRRQLGRASLKAFCKLYLARHFSKPCSPMHDEMFALLESATKERRARLAIAAPRGHAKTTVVSLAYLLWSIVYELEPYIVLISNTADQAAQILVDLRHELESNPLILEDFPEVAEPPGRKPSPKRWAKREILTRNKIRVSAFGARQKLRGRKHGAHRPSLILLDDIEGEAEASSAELRETLEGWFERTVLKAGVADRTNVLVVGTLLHYDSLLARRVGIGRERPAAGWTARRYQAVISWADRDELWQEWENIYGHRAEHEGRSGPTAALEFYRENEGEMLQGTNVLWPDLESYYQLMEIRLTEGRASFDSEKQNDPVDASSCFFNPDRFCFWDDEYGSEAELLEAIGTNGSFYGACDPSLGKAGRGRDDTAIVTLLKDRHTCRLYVLDADIRRQKPLETIDAILELHQRRKFRRFVMEGNQFQDFFADELRRRSRQRGINLTVHKVNQVKDKLGRIQNLEPKISTGALWFSRRHRLLLEQLRQFPRGAHDDGPDALEMAVHAARLAIPRLIILDGTLW